MKMNSKQSVKILTIASVLIATFALGYYAGSKTQDASVTTTKSLSASDMEHAFGRVKPTDLEPIMQDNAAKSLGSLVEGLEKKVAANPENIDQQLLLAQTYNELDSREKSLVLLRKLNKQEPKNPQVKITLATVLMKSSDKQELNEALRMFDDAIKLKPDAGSMARLYQGEIKVKLEGMPK
jgi:cytochrome c-type biogenesis protein CcmH/NrfG